MKTEELKTGQDRGEMLNHLKKNFTETEKIIYSRRSVRWYKKEQVPEFMVKRILEAGRFAPSAGNCQPWKFLVIREPEIIDGLTKSIIRITRLFKSVLEYRLRGSFWKLPIAKLYIKLMPNKLHPVPFSAVTFIADEKLGLFHGAPTVILILKDVRGVSNPDLDIGIAGQNMVLAANSMGLGTCWVSFVTTVFDYTRKWHRRLGIKYPWKVCTSLAIGWSVGNPNGMVTRPTHAIDWFENGKKTVLDPGGPASIGFFEKRKVPHYSKPSQTQWGDLVFNHAICNKCGYCVRICPASALVQDDDKLPKKNLEDPLYGCMSCGDCVAICPKGAITLKSDYNFTKRFKTLEHGGLKPPRL